MPLRSARRALQKGKDKRDEPQRVQRTRRMRKAHSSFSVSSGARHRLRRLRGDAEMSMGDSAAVGYAIVGGAAILSSRRNERWRSAR